MEVKYFHGYAVREDGEVRGKRGGAVKHTTLRNGSGSVTLYYDGSSHSFTIAKLVVAHKDGDPTNNHKDNLMWVNRGKNPLAIRIMCTMPDGTSKVYESQNEAARELGLASNAIIRHYISGAMKDPRGGVWKKVE